MTDGARTVDGRAWVLWTLSAALLATLTRNPLYLLIILLAARLVWLRRRRPGSGIDLPLGKVAAVILTFSTLFNFLFVHLGNTVLLRLPAGWPLIGGPLTAEAAVYGTINGLMLLTLLVVFLAFNNIVPGSELVHLTPRVFHNLGLVVLIALTYVPETRRHWEKIKQAQAVRGHEIRGWRDWRPILLPLLVGGLERAMSLAEAMVARGYGATAQAGQSLQVQVMLLLGLGAAFTGWLLGFWLGWPGWVLLAGGVGTLLLLLWHLRRDAPARLYAERGWGWGEWTVAGAALVPLLLLAAPWPFFEAGRLSYVPYPQLALPEFRPLIGLALLLLALPGMMAHDD